MYNKSSQKKKNRRALSQYDKGHLSKTILNSEIYTFSLRSGTRHGYPFKPIPFNIILEVLASFNKARKRKERVQNEKEVAIWFLFIDNILIYNRQSEEMYKTIMNK